MQKCPINAYYACDYCDTLQFVPLMPCLFIVQLHALKDCAMPDKNCRAHLITCHQHSASSPQANTVRAYLSGHHNLSRTSIQAHHTPSPKLTLRNHSSSPCPTIQAHLTPPFNLTLPHHSSSPYPTIRAHLAPPFKPAERGAAVRCGKTVNIY